MKQSKLMRCPFCGGEGDVHKFANLYYGYCKSCTASTNWNYTRNAAIQSWNTRFINGVRVVYHWKENGFKVICDAAPLAPIGKAVKHG